MHELSYMSRLADIAIKQLPKDNDVHPVKLVVEIGELTGVLPEYLKKYYPSVTKGTPLSGSALEVISIPAKARCNSCSSLYHPDKEHDYLCPNCKSSFCHFVCGRELNVRELVICRRDSPDKNPPH